MMNPVSWLQMTNMISYQGLVRTFHRSRTYDLRITNALLYQLSYTGGLMFRVVKKAGQVN